MKYLPIPFIVATLKVEVECGKQIWKLIIRTCFIPNHVYVTFNFKEIHEPIRCVNCVIQIKTLIITVEKNSSKQDVIHICDDILFLYFGYNVEVKVKIEQNLYIY